MRSEESGQGEPVFLAPTQDGYREGVITVGEAEPIQNGCGPCFKRISVKTLVMGVEVAVEAEGFFRAIALRHACLDFAQPRLDVEQLIEALQYR
mgnify:CR=1 FL=1